MRPRAWSERWPRLLEPAAVKRRSFARCRGSLDIEAKALEAVEQRAPGAALALAAALEEQWRQGRRGEELSALELLQSHGLEAKTLEAFRKTRRGAFAARLSVNGHLMHSDERLGLLGSALIHDNT